SNGTDSLYIKNNHFTTDGGDGINIDDAYVEIRDNYFEGCDLDTGLECNGRIYNNEIKEGNVRTSAYLDVYQNIGFNGEAGITITYRNESCFNNLSINNQYAFNGVFSDYYNNCIFLRNDELSLNGVHGTPIFRNCIIDFPLESPLIDGGGNIWVDSVQAQTLFEDIENGDFHLIEGSLAIDAGFDTLGYYYPFDMDYNHRIWDGDNNGTVIIDIGPYEYGSPTFGGIEGYSYNPTTGDPVDYVLLKINNQPGEFTFTDSIGNFQFKLPAGVYDIYAERVFYEDIIEYQVEVIDGQFTQIAIPMLEIVDMEEQTIPNPSSQISNLMNYPNPFNPTTTISFSVTQNSDFVNLEVYNIKGQKIKTLLDCYIDPGRSEMIWNSKDDDGKGVSSGVYFYKLNVNGKTEKTKKMLLLR
ncbi:MAG: T9SS type A sorting domain-containing protein, partial [Candidatus Cloacimonetes bacterium]|nr:T9SS type A sorting domain-containing protein [Candidatus Cloacimonadota bacterium]